MAKKKTNRRKSSPRGLGRLVSARALASTGIEAATGGGSFYLHRFAVQKIPALQKNWWVGPLAVIGAGHVVKAAKHPMVSRAGSAITAVGGYGAAMAYESYKAGQAASGGQQQQQAQNDANAVYGDHVLEAAAVVGPEDMYHPEVDDAPLGIDAAMMMG